MRETRPSKGKTAPDSERGFFMPKSSTLDVEGSLVSLKIQEGSPLQGLDFAANPAISELPLQNTFPERILSRVIGSPHCLPLRTDTPPKIQSLSATTHSTSPYQSSFCLLSAGVSLETGGYPHAGCSDRQKVVQNRQPGIGQRRGDPGGAEALASGYGPGPVAPAFERTEPNQGHLDGHLQTQPETQVSPLPAAGRVFPLVVAVQSAAIPRVAVLFLTVLLLLPLTLSAKEHDPCTSMTPVFQPPLDTGWQKACREQEAKRKKAVPKTVLKKKSVPDYERELLRASR